MAELWQAYGNWILFALFFILMMGHHLFMGHGGHGGRRVAAGGTAHGEGHGEGHRERHDEAPKEVHGEGNLEGHAEGHPHSAKGSAATPRRYRGHSGGCCH
ncbi:MAG: hypothetical protein QN152_09845 [Armatimonadota bacterium]|nr:hypothetical protein [Armatimonadota bacterium]MDR7426511.1 hypothetical protein [Armatimonadota bacterium]MDR7464760.1 hypothetical protein [Armatimonadota bacterium]MDR7468537.1 hypothetical protein [Armatimonadota bacterium]MDR7475130.1 hypothetical protein [Armatimonadota bacterium]